MHVCLVYEKKEKKEKKGIVNVIFFPPVRPTPKEVCERSNPKKDC
jgi:hypothetical protein